MNTYQAKIGYARTSTTDQNLDAQIAALKAAGCGMVRTEQKSGASLEGRPELKTILDLDRREIAVFEALGYDPQSTDALSQLTGLPADQLMQSLLLLELEGLAHSAPGGYLRAG